MYSINLGPHLMTNIEGVLRLHIFDCQISSFGEDEKHL